MENPRHCQEKLGMDGGVSGIAVPEDIGNFRRGERVLNWGRIDPDSTQIVKNPRKTRAIMILMKSIMILPLTESNRQSL